jgi:hypothetical protein
VKDIKIIFRFLRILLFAFMFSACMILGVVPIIPKRKEQHEIEIRIEEADEKTTINSENGEVKKVG